MVMDYLLLSFFGTMIVSGTFTCPGSMMALKGSKCYKLMYGNPVNGQDKCTNDNPNAVLRLPPTNDEAKNISLMFPDATIWVGLRFLNGTDWFWGDGSLGPTKLRESYRVPQLCIVVRHIGLDSDGLLHDRYCYKTDGLVCQKEINTTTNGCESGWKNIENHCYKRLRDSSAGVNFNDAQIICSNESAYVMMPHSKREAKQIEAGLSCGEFCWIGLTDFDADHTYTWENGTDINQSRLYFKKGQPDRRQFDYMCANIKNEVINIGECQTDERVICVINAIDSSQTVASEQMSTQTEGLSSHTQTKVFTPASRTNVTFMTTKSTSLEFTNASVMSSTDTGENTEHTGTSAHNSAGQFDNTTIIIDKYLVSNMPDSKLPCILKCTSICANSTTDASTNMPYKVNRKLLSSYRRTHCSANDTRMSSFYIGCIGIAVLLLTVLFIIMLDCLPRA